MRKRDSISRDDMDTCEGLKWLQSELKKQIKSVLDQNELKLLHESLNPYLSTLEV